MHPGVFRDYPRMMVMTRNVTFGKWFWPQKSQLFVGFHVGSMALSLLMHMGCKKAILLGQDLAYDPVTKQSHFQGQLAETVAVEMERIDGEAACQVLGNSGKQLSSTVYWDFFRKDIEAITDTTEMDVFNAIPLEYGAKIRGTQRIDPVAVDATLLAGLPRRDFAAELKTIMSKTSDEVGLAPRLDRVMTAMQAIEQPSLELMRQVGEFFCDQKSAREVTDFVTQCRVEIAAIINLDTEAYNGVLNCFLMGFHIKVLTTLENLDPVGAPDQYRMVSSQMLQLWLAELVYWSRRVRYLLGSYLEGGLAA
jgi:hypothetical protein